MPSLPDIGQSCNPHLAALMAINIVTEVVDEAQDILNTAKDLGQPWRDVWRQKKGNGEFYENAEILGILENKADGLNEETCIMNQNDDMMVTSTPQKETDGIPKTHGSSLIGQGDEDTQTINNDLRSPSSLISRLFDMSEVEQAVNIEASDYIQIDLETKDFTENCIAKLVESYVTLALNTVCENVLIAECEVTEEILEDNSNSSYSMLADVLASDGTASENITLCDGNVNDEEDEDQEITQMKEKTVNYKDDEEVTNKDIDMYEKTFSTLNRDYDKYLEEDNFYEDQKSILIMQEVELSTNKVLENIAVCSKPSPQILTKETDPVFSPVAEGTNKNTLAKRCRLQGAKLMSRLRNWWWKQRLIARRKGGRSNMSGICPLSPNARAASLLDHRKSRTSSASGAWKFNTVNEALIHSYNRKELGLESRGSVEDL